MEFDLRPRKIDLYIIRKFISTFFVALILIIGIVIIFDISERIDDFVAKEAPLRAIIFDYCEFRSVLYEYVQSAVRIHNGDILHFEDGR